MHRTIHSRLPVVAASSLLTLIALATMTLINANAGLRGPGRYCGVVIFDRWDTCFLLSGHFITYISQNVKNELRPYKGQAMQVDARDVFQPENPGDALIREYKILGPAPDTGKWATLDGLELTATNDFGPRGTPTFLLEIRNAGSEPVNINSHEFGPTMLAKTSRSPYLASDGDSMAVITRGDLMNPSSWASTVGGVTHSYSYTIDPKTRLQERFVLSPGQSVRARITVVVPPGQYQFLFGYGGGVHEEKSLASNAISFDIMDDGVAALVE